MPGVLGAGVNSAAIYSRGGGTQLLPLSKLTGLEWNRNRNAFSTAQVTVSNADKMYPQLGDVHTWAHELVLFRDSKRVWEGPVRFIDYGTGDTTVMAVDVAGWLAKRAVRLKRMVAEGHESPVTYEMYVSLYRALITDDPNVLPYLLRIAHAQEAKVTRDVKAGSGYYSGDFTGLASQGGNFTVLGRRVIMYPDEVLLGRTETLTDQHVTGEIRVQEDGDSLATTASAVDSNGVVRSAIATDPDVNATTGISTFYGRHDAVVSVDHASGGAALSAVALAAVAQLYPAPTRIDMSGDSVLKATAPVTIDQLVPGTLIPVAVTSTPRRAQGTMILDGVKVTQSGAGEEVSITVTSASAYAGSSE